MLLHKLCCRRIVAGEKYTPISSTLGLDRKQFCIFVMFFLSRIYLFIFGRLGRKSFFFLWNLYFTKYLAKMSSSNSNPYLAKILGIFPHDKAATSQLYILYTVQYNIYTVQYTIYSLYLNFLKFITNKTFISNCQSYPRS